MEHYLKITDEGVVYGKRLDNSKDIVYDDSKRFNDFEEGYEWIYDQFGVEKRDIQYIHQLDI